MGCRLKDVPLLIRHVFQFLSEEAAGWTENLNCITDFHLVSLLHQRDGCVFIIASDNPREAVVSGICTCKVILILVCGLSEIEASGELAVGILTIGVNCPSVGLDNVSQVEYALHSSFDFE